MSAIRPVILLGAVLALPVLTEKILEAVEDTGANLVVIGSRGLSDLKGMWLGSVSHKVAHSSPVNVITVR